MKRVDSYWLAEDLQSHVASSEHMRGVLSQHRQQVLTEASQQARFCQVWREQGRVGVRLLTLLTVLRQGIGGCGMSMSCGSAVPATYDGRRGRASDPRRVADAVMRGESILPYVLLYCFFGNSSLSPRSD
jgi:hypothetical protein